MRAERPVEGVGAGCKGGEEGGGDGEMGEFGDGNGTEAGVLKGTERGGQERRAYRKDERLIRGRKKQILTRLGRSS